ncbi:MAG TPA: NifB/NifX family molybdenum-iron cluster-binding protein [Spirochaetia bacterium]|nr:NifB/NifX family molybdenum-iron cluster-binding protein [Spirochaetia bacterium]
MKIALPVAGGQLCTHFGHCERFHIFDIDQGSQEILRVSTLNAPPHEPGLLPRLLSEEGVNVVIAGGMGSRAQELFDQNGVKVVTGADPTTGSPEDILRFYLSGSLHTGANVCDH